MFAEVLSILQGTAKALLQPDKRIFAVHLVLAHQIIYESDPVLDGFEPCVVHGYPFLLGIDLLHYVLQFNA